MRIRLRGRDRARRESISRPEASMAAEEPVLSQQGGSHRQFLKIFGLGVLGAGAGVASSVTARPRPVSAAQTINDDLYVTGKLGVGMSGPGQSQLHIVGASPSVIIQANNTAGANLDFWANNRGYITGRIANNEGAATGRGVLIFSNRNDAGALTENLRIDGQNGYVGVGLANPGALLTLKSSGRLGWDNGSGTADVRMYRVGTGILGIIAPNGDSGELRIRSTSGRTLIGATGALKISTDVDNDETTRAIQFGHDNLDFYDTLMVIQESGNVGIGTSAPVRKLDVVGDVYASQNLYAMGNVGIGTTNPSANLHIVGTGAENLYVDAYSNDAVGPRTRLRKARGSLGSPTIVQDGDELGYYLFRGYDGSTFDTAAWVGAFVDGTPSIGSMPARLVFSTTPTGSAGSVERMRIDNQGNVGIGTIAPAGKLDVAGDIRINGAVAIGADAVAKKSYYAD